MSPDAKPALLLANPAAGGGRTSHLLTEARSALDAAGVEHRLVLTEGIEHGRKEAAEAAADGSRVLVMSGDGLIGQVGGVLAGSGAALGIVPGGRGNDLARVLGIPTGIPEAAALIAAGHTRAIDVGEVNGARFLCIASCGFDSEANRIANEAKRVKGPLVYAYAALRALAAWRPVRFTLTADDGRERWELTGYTVAAANSRAYGGGMFIAPDAELDDGLLDVVSIAAVSKRRFLQGLPAVFRGEHVSRPEVEVRRCAELRIEADRPLTVYADGDPIAELPATVRLLPRALHVLVPESDGSP
jgi:YegS/Rv2252/BmrU family lipid kinase